MSLKNNSNNGGNLTSEIPAPKIFIPYPQTLDPMEFLPKPNSRKPCNGFMIYRKVYQKQLNANAYRFKMTTISRWASALWLTESENLKDAYREFASKIAKLHVKNHQTKLENLKNRLDSISLLTTAPYPFESQQFIAPISDLTQYNNYYVNQSFPITNLYSENQMRDQPFSNNSYGSQQSVNSPLLTIPLSNENFENETSHVFFTSPGRPSTSEFDQYFF